MQKGLLLINLGTPDGADVRSVRRYLKEFLSDPRVIDLPSPIRYALLYAFILPFRPKKSAHAYQSIWTEKGSPLLLNGKALQSAVQQQLGGEWKVALGMRYGQPSIASALEELSDCSKICVFPLFPQYSSAATGSALEKLMDIQKKARILPELHIVRDFYRAPYFIQAQAERIRPHLEGADHLIFSYHGLPQRQLEKEGCQPVCLQPCALETKPNAGCYRAQCFASSHALAEALGMNKQQYTTAFQSRLGQTPWIQPYTDATLADLAAKGVKNILISCPSFASDCLETIEEIGIAAKEQWQRAGGTSLQLIPCVNDDPIFAKGIAETARNYCA